MRNEKRLNSLYQGLMRNPGQAVKGFPELLSLKSRKSRFVNLPEELLGSCGKSRRFISHY